MANPFVHVELSTTDVAKAKTFYGKLFDWKLEDVPIGDSTYTMVRVGEGTGGGLMKQPIPGAPSAWLAYVQVDDLEAATSKAKSLGAKVMQEEVEVMGVVEVAEPVDVARLPRRHLEQAGDLREPPRPQG
jgi:uncharacterized protein